MRANHRSFAMQLPQCRPAKKANCEARLWKKENGRTGHEVVIPPSARDGGEAVAGRSGVIPLGFQSRSHVHTAIERQEMELVTEAFLICRQSQRFPASCANSSTLGVIRSCGRRLHSLSSC